MSLSFGKINVISFEENKNTGLQTYPVCFGSDEHCQHDGMSDPNSYKLKSRNATP